MRQEHGFTLIELMIVIAIIAIIALIAIPNLLSSRLVANETSTIGTLRSLSSAEAEFQARQIVDQDADGLGEYGFLQELAGSVIPRGAASLLDPPSISQASPAPLRRRASPIASSMRSPPSAMARHSR